MEREKGGIIMSHKLILQFPGDGGGGGYITNFNALLLAFRQ